MLLLVLLVAFEGLLRIYDHQNPNCFFLRIEIFDNLDEDLKRSICQDHHNIRWSYDPYLHVEPNQHYNTININQDGFRGKEVSLEKPQDTLRVFVVGGSTIFGVGSSSDSTTVPGYLQKQYDLNSDLNVEVINAGTPKAYSFSNGNYIKDNLINYEPDLFIIYTGWNDLGRSEDGNYFDTKPHVYSQGLDNVISLLLKNDYYKSINILYRNYVLWKISTVENIIVRNYVHSEQISENWQSTWNEVCELGKRNNFNVIITLQPLLGSGSKQLTNEENANYKLYNQHTKLSNYEIFADKLSGLDKCTKAKDLRNIFQNTNQTIFFDAGHTGDGGNELIAKELFELSLPILKEKNQ